MAQKSGFFNAVVSGGVADRVYTADDINSFFNGILSDGVFSNVGNALLVSAGDSGLTVKVNTGKAFVNQHWFTSDTIVTLTLNRAHTTLNRYTGIAVRYTRSTRSVELVTVDGTPASTPVAPDLVHTDDVYEIALALVYVGAGVTTITSSNIIDSRTYVYGLVDPMTLNYRRYNTVQTGYESGQRYFDISTSYDFTLNTKLEVYANGLLIPETDYTIQVNEVEGNYMVVFNTAQALNTKLSFIMIN